ncbi:MAG TPA: hypothetical protein VNO50_02125 [Pyrinomonadaceae bacterium]|nr:hypothetical protein [Pyrinomonadaceae bacterium]
MKVHESWICRFAVVLIASACLVGIAAGQTQKQGSSSKRGPASPGFSLRVFSADLLVISLKADSAALANIAGELSKKLQLPVHLGASVAKLEVTTDFRRMMLEPALHLLAPVVYVDYEIKYAPGQQPRAVAIYLGGFVDPVPPINATLTQSSQVYMFEGNTEQDSNPEATAAKEKSLLVSFKANALTVKAKQQPLNVVLSRVANEIGIPLDIRDPIDEVVDIDLDQMPLEDAVARLAPNVRLYVRADLQRSRRTPFRIVLLARNQRS